MFARHTADRDTDLVFLSCIFNLKQLVQLVHTVESLFH